MRSGFATSATLAECVATGDTVPGMAEGRQYGKRQRNAFTWYWEDTDGGEHEQVFHAKRQLSFEELVEYDTQRVITNTEVSHDARVTVQKLVDLEAAQEETVDFEAVGKWLRERAEGQTGQWDVAVDNILLLVIEAERDSLRPLLIAGDPRDVSQLRADLEEVVLGRVKQEVQVAAGVDPTLPTPPSDSPPAEDSGPTSA